MGLTGPNAAGKSEVARHLVQRGFAYHSLSDIVREEADRLSLDHSRENLIRVGNDLRREGGPAVLARRIRSRLQGNSVIDSIRNPAEVKELRRDGRFRLLGVEAPIEVRFQRSQRRARIGDGDSLDEFRRREEMENTSDPAAQQLRATLALADARLSNGAGLEDLFRGVEEQLATWGMAPPDHA